MRSNVRPSIGFGAAGCILCLLVLVPRAPGVNQIGAHEFYALQSNFGGREDTDAYWACRCVIYASVAELRQSPHGEKRMVLRPMGTLTGAFDAGKTRELEVPFNQGFPTRVGDRVVVALLDTGSCYYIPPQGPQYILQDEYPRFIEPLTVVDGLADRKMEAILATIQKIRSKPQLDSGESAAFWQAHSLVYASVKSVDSDQGTVKIDFQALGTLSGYFDPGKTAGVKFSCELGKIYFYLDESVGHVPSVGDKMLLLVRGDAVEGHWHVADMRSALMPRTHDPIIRVSTSGDPQADKLAREMINSALARIQDVRRTGSAGVAR
jgi:hypothetical protein